MNIKNLVVTEDGKVISEPVWDIFVPVGTYHQYLRWGEDGITRHLWFDKINNVTSGEFRGSTKLNMDPKEATKIANELAIIFETGQPIQRAAIPQLIQTVIEKQQEQVESEKEKPGNLSKTKS
jgi:hypothetical protein